jgi:hypothetical protein
MTVHVRKSNRGMNNQQQSIKTKQNKTTAAGMPQRKET